MRVGAGEEWERVEARQGSVLDPDVIVTGDAETFLAVASGHLGPEDALESGALRVEGDREALLARYRHAIGPTVV
jgi:putative sterol carrier protein